MARYIAASASRISSPGSSPPRAMAIPMLVVTKCSLPARTNGRVNTAAIRSASSIASRSLVSSSSRIPNSSPPNRATVSLVRTACLSRGAAAARSSSPT